MSNVTALKDPRLVSSLDGYEPGAFFCELLGRERQPSRQLTPLWHRLQTSELQAMRQRALDAERELFNLGITFTVYS